MIRLLQFADVINRYDFIDTIVQYADSERFEMSVCRKTEKSNIAEPRFPDGTRHVIIEWNGQKQIPAAARRLSRLLGEWEIDIVHAHHFEPALIAWLATRLNKRTKFVFGRHYSDLIQNLSGLKRRYFLAAEQMMNKAAERIIVPSTMIAGILTEDQKIEDSKIDIVPYGFAAEKYENVTEGQIAAAEEEFGLRGKFVVATVGKLTAGKGVRYLADAAVKLSKRIDDLLVLFIGEGEERGYIESVIERHGLHEKVKIAGWRKDAMAVLAGAHVVVQPTLSEAFSQVMGEAMWMGKPLVMTEVSGATDIIETGVNGILIPKASAEAIESSVLILFEDEGLRVRIGNKGREFVANELAIDKVIRLYEKSYLKALARPTL